MIELSAKLLRKYSGLAGLMRADFGDLCNEHGLGAAKASQIKAALELGRRLAATQPEERVQVRSPADAAKLVICDMDFYRLTWRAVFRSRLLWRDLSFSKGLFGFVFPCSIRLSSVLKVLVIVSLLRGIPFLVRLWRRGT